MSHRALTLKYRPQVFADLVGQDHVSEVLGMALETKRVAHAYLFTGARGVGKTTSARILAKALNCERRGSGQMKGPDPCNVCTSCTEITSGVSLDVAEIDGASNRGIADVQALREKVRFAPTGGRYRVVIIDEVHQLSNDAFAALLKTLEEPPPHLVFIFATTDPQKLPDTIRSRTQRFDFARVSIRKIADRLLDLTRRESQDPEGVHFTLTEGAAILIAQKSEGALRDAVSALDQVVSSGEREVNETLVRRVLGIADREAFFALADAIVGRDPKAALHALHQGFAKGLDARDLAEGLSEHVRHILILKVDPEGSDLVAATGEELARLRQQGEGWSEQDLLRLLRNASEVLWPMRDSPQPMVHLEAAVLQMATLDPGETLAELLSRLEALERRLGGASGPTATGRTGGAGFAPDRTAGAAAPVAPALRAMGMPAASPARASAPGGMPAPGPGGARVFAPVAPPASPPPPSAPRASAAATSATISATATALASTDEAGFELDEKIELSWREVVTAINRRKRILGAFLEESRFLGLSGSVVMLATDDLHRAVIEEQENRGILAEEVGRCFGRAIDVVCAAGDINAAATPTPDRADVHAMIDRAVAWFDGEAVTPPERKPTPTRGRGEWPRRSPGAADS